MYVHVYSSTGIAMHTHLYARLQYTLEYVHSSTTCTSFLVHECSRVHTLDIRVRVHRGSPPFACSRDIQDMPGHGRQGAYPSHDTGIAISIDAGTAVLKYPSSARVDTEWDADETITGNCGSKRLSELLNI